MVLYWEDLEPERNCAHSGFAFELDGVKASCFGAFVLVQSNGQVTNLQSTVRILVGQEPTSFSNFAVNLGDSTATLNFTGLTRINGDIVLQSQRIQSTGFRGIPYRGRWIGKSVGQGQSGQAFSSQMLDDQFDQFSDLFKRVSVARSDFRGLLNSVQGDTLFFDEDQSWNLSAQTNLSEFLTLIVSGKLRIEGEGTFGKFTSIIVQDSLLVTGEVNGEHLLMYAKNHIELSGQTQMSTQLLSKGSISIKDESYLTYPSLVYSSRPFQTFEDAESIRIADQAVVDGTVILSGESVSGNNQKARIKIEKDAIVRGAVYSDQQVDIEGTVLGSIITDQFYFYDAPTSYVNWIRDATIDVSQRPANFQTPIGFGDSVRFAVIDWWEVNQ